MAKYPVQVTTSVRPDPDSPGFNFIEHALTFADSSKDFVSSRYHETTPLHVAADNLNRQVGLLIGQFATDFPSVSVLNSPGVASPNEDAAAPVLLTTGPITFTASQVKAFRASPQKIINSPGPSKFIKIAGFVEVLRFGTQYYNANGGNAWANVSYGVSGQQVAFSGASFGRLLTNELVASEMQFTNGAFIAFGVNLHEDQVADKDIYITGGDAEFLNGDSPWTVVIDYSIVDLPV